MRPSTRMWAAVGVGITAYEVMCPHGETLSERVDDVLEGSPYKRAVTLGAIAITALHLSNVLPEVVDPYHYALRWKHENSVD
ncbi:MAG: hypothetical protein ABIR46_03065 [Candidatus Saccharimonadales bacterium]